jgi:hypothetical protein
MPQIYLLFIMVSEEYDDPICPITIQNNIIIASDTPMSVVMLLFAGS